MAWLLRSLAGSLKGINLRRFAISGLLNYLASNAIFTVLWVSLQKDLPYVTIAVIASVASIGFSLLVHRKITFYGEGPSNGSSRAYYGFHLSVFALSLYGIPEISNSFGVDILIIQYIWSFLGSIVGVAILNLFLARNRTHR